MRKSSDKDGKAAKKNLSDEAILLRIRKYCALRERSAKEVQKKLYELGVLEDKAQVIAEKLTREGFLNEKRFAEAFARGKFRNKKWGKKKIELELKRKGIQGELLEKGISEIDNADYEEVLDKLLQKKWKQLHLKGSENEGIEDSLFSPAVQKLINYAMQKGYEYELIVSRVKKII